MITSGFSKVSKTIPQFYAGRSVFITGGTGFLGKVLIEKILRSCPDVEEVFVLMRPKKSQSVDERLKWVLSLPLYDRIKKERPGFEVKIIPVQGDASMEGLGLGPMERQILQERVSVVFHIAASVKFDDTLKQAVFNNVRSTRDVCILAQGMKKLVALVHVSSTYAHSDKPVVHEIVYPPLMDWRKLIKIAENLDDNLLRPMTAKILGTMANTYVFTKRLAEQVVTDFSTELPLVICRPSIVTNSMTEPMTGWLDNYNGPVGLMIGGGTGILRVALVRPDLAMDFAPVDIPIKIILIAAYRRGLETLTQNPKVLVCHAASHGLARMTTRELIYDSFNIVKKEPLEGTLWYPGFHLVSNRFVYYVMTMVLQVIPAFFVDLFLRFYGRKPILMKLQRKIFTASYTLSFFVLNEWTFVTIVSLGLFEEVLPEDAEAFTIDYNAFYKDQYLKASLDASKIYLLKQKTTNSKEAMQHFHRMWWLDRIFKTWIVAMFSWILYWLGFFAYLEDSVWSILTGTIFETL